jgi:hypothetical protein
VTNEIVHTGKVSLWDRSFKPDHGGPRIPQGQHHKARSSDTPCPGCANKKKKHNH